MALSILQYPASSSLAQSPIVFSVSESSAANTSASFQYNCDLYYWTGLPNASSPNPAYTLVKYPNASNVGIFDVSKIINSTLVDLRQQNPSNITYFKGDFYFQYRSGSAYATGSKVSSGVYAALDGYSLFQEPINQQIVSKSEFWPLMTDGPATQSIFDTNKGEIGVFTLDGSNNDVNFILYSSSLTSSYVQLSSSLNSNEIVQQISAFPSEDGFPITYNGNYSICTVSASVSESIETLTTNVSASFFSEEMAEGENFFNINLEAQILNNANSICWYTASLDTLYVVSVNNDPIFSFDGGAGQECARVKGIDCSTGEVTLETDWLVSGDGTGFTGSLVFAQSCDTQDNIFLSSSFYTVETLVSGTPVSCLYFEEICQQKYPNIRVKWKNRYGQYDYHNFYLVNRQSFTTTNRSYQPQIGSWEGSTLSYNNYDSAKLNYIVDSEQQITVNSGYLSEQYNEIFKQLLVSEEIYWVYGDNEENLRPITIATQNVTFKTGVVDKLIQYQFDFTWGQGYKLIL
jgi:hypothetical protein